MQCYQQYKSINKNITAANAIFLQSTAPIYVLIFEPLLTKIKWERINIITIAVCFLGMILFFMGDLTPGDIKGNIASLLAGIAFATFFLGMKKRSAVRRVIYLLRKRNSCTFLHSVYY